MLGNLVGRLRRAAAAFLGTEDDRAAQPKAEPRIDRAVETRICKERIEGLGRYDVQRANWKKLFEAEWPEHLTAQRMLERAIHDGREQTASLLRLLGRDPSVGPMPELYAEEFKKAMEEAAASAPKETSPASVVALALFATTLGRAECKGESWPEAEAIGDAARYLDAGLFTSSDLVELGEALLHGLYVLEKESLFWKELYLGQQRRHAEAQANLQTSIAMMSQRFLGMLAGLNSLRATKGETPVRTREELKEALEKAASGIS